MKQPINGISNFTVPEWGTLDLKGRTLAEGDRLLASHLRSGSDSRLSVDELRDGLRINAKSWVGLVRFHDFELQVIPKLVGNNLALVELIDFATGLDALDRHPAVRTIHGTDIHLFDLIALLFVEACERVVRNGLLSDYCEIEEDLPVVRGRLLVKQQVLKRFGRIDRLECRYDETMTDILENRILHLALSVCANKVEHPATSMRIRRLLNIFSEVCDVGDMDLRLARSSLTYDRKNEHYRESHDLAWLILDGLGIEDIFATGSHECFAFLLDMNRLFESFIERWFRQLFKGSEFRVIPQHRDRTILWNTERDRGYAAVIPDLLLERASQPGRYLPVDAKYKLYDERKIVSGDIYQTFLYAYAYGEHHNPFPTALLMYPASSDSGRIRLHIRRSGRTVSAELRAIPIHIPTALAEAKRGKSGPIANDLMGIVRTVFLNKL